MDFGVHITNLTVTQKWFCKLKAGIFFDILGLWDNKVGTKYYGLPLGLQTCDTSPFLMEFAFLLALGKHMFNKLLQFLSR